jgi:plasmid stability protein
MRQLLLRIPDDLHARLTGRARRCGRSANAIATEILEQGVSDESGDARATLRSRARRLGVLASPTVAMEAPADRKAALESVQGIGPILDELLAEGR